MLARIALMAVPSCSFMKLIFFMSFWHHTHYKFHNLKFRCAKQIWLVEIRWRPKHFLQLELFMAGIFSSGCPLKVLNLKCHFCTMNEKISESQSLAVPPDLLLGPFKPPAGVIERHIFLINFPPWKIHSLPSEGPGSAITEPFWGKTKCLAFCPVVRLYVFVWI